MNRCDNNINPPKIERFFVNEITSDGFVGKWKIKIVMAVNTASPIVATYAYSSYLLVYREYKISKLPSVSSPITPAIAALYIRETNILLLLLLNTFLKYAKAGIPVNAILIRKNKNTLVA